MGLGIVGISAILTLRDRGFIELIIQGDAGDIELGKDIVDRVPFLDIRTPVTKSLLDVPIHLFLVIKPCVSVHCKLQITAAEIVLHDVQRHIVELRCLRYGYMFAIENRIKIPESLSLFGDFCANMEN